MPWYTRFLISATIGVALAFAFLIFLVSHITEREAILYSGFYPPDIEGRSLEVGDFFVVQNETSIPLEGLKNSCPGLAISLRKKYEATKIEVEVRSVLADKIGFVGSIIPSLKGTTRVLASNTISGPDIVAALAETTALPTDSDEQVSCETLVAKESDGRCVVVVTNVQSTSVSPTENELYGFSFPRGCQLVGFKSAPDGWSQPRVSFDRAFGVGRLERLWIQLTQPLIQVVERPADLS